MKSGNPNTAPVKETMASHLPIAGTPFSPEPFFFAFRFGIQSSTHPTGQRYLQKNSFLNQAAISTTNPIIFSKTNDFKASTELSVIKGLIQFDKPLSLPQPKGSDKKSAAQKTIKRMLYFLTKIYVLEK